MREQETALHEFVDANKPRYQVIKRDDVSAKTGTSIPGFACAKLTALSGAVDSDPGWGEDKYGKKHFSNMNNHSVVLRVDFGKASYLVTGDLEEPALRDLVEKYRGTALLDVDVLQAGHHGSANGTTSDLVSAVTPKIVLIAMGPEARHHNWTAWAYGHPRESAVQMLEASPALLPRAPVEVNIGTKVKGFVPEKLSKAIYGTGWDGAVDVVMDASGALSVTTARP